MSKLKIDLVMDSGAFSAFTKSIPVNLSEYISFCKKNAEYIKTVINLDSINPGDPEFAALVGWNNFNIMRDAGIDAVPVYHAREDIKWVDKMIDATDYIGISGTSLVSPAEDRQFQDQTWEHITDSQGRAIVKTHSFGNTSQPILMKYPWSTADSATWVIQAGRAARVKINGKFYQLRSNMIKDTNYIDVNDPAPKKQEWQRAIGALGLNADKVMALQAKPSVIAMLRSYLVASELMQLEVRTTPINTYKVSSPLLTTKKQLDGGFVREGPCKIHLVISPSAYFFNFPIIALLGVTKILVSYFYVATAPKPFWNERLLPFMADPLGYCENDAKVRPFLDALRECLVTPSVVGASND